MMKMCDVVNLLQKSVGQRVWVKTATVDSAVLLVVNVDAEGCTCRVLENSDYDPSLPYWWSFEEIAEAHAEEANPSEASSNE
jgi:hypothetical protein